MSKERLEEIEKELCEIQKLIKKGSQEDIKKINEKIIDLYCNNHVDFLFNQVKQELNLVKAHELKDLEHQGLVRQLKEKDEQNKRYREELDILGEVINSAPNADKLNEEYERLKGLEGEEC